MFSFRADPDSRVEGSRVQGGARGLLFLKNIYKYVLYIQVQVQLQSINQSINVLLYCTTYIHYYSTYGYCFFFSQFSIKNLVI